MAYTRALTNQDISQWIDNDESLYNWWRGSRMSKTKFIQENKQELKDCILAVLNREPSR